MDSQQIINQSTLERLRQIGGDSLLSQMIDLFLEHTPKRLEAAHQGWGEQDLDAIERAAHSIKSSAANLGAFHLQEIASKIERQAADRNPNTLDTMIAEMDQHFKLAQDQLTQERAKIGA